MFSSSSGEISSLSDLECGDLPLWLMLVELPELEGGICQTRIGIGVLSVLST